MDNPSNESDTEGDEEKQKEQMTFDLLKEDYKTQAEKRDKISEEVRSLLSSILVVVGFLLAAGTTSVVNIQSIISLFYFIGISLLITSIFFVAMVMRIREEVIPDRTRLYFQLNSAEIKYRTILRRNIAMYNELIKVTKELNYKKQRLLITAWWFMIIGLIVIMLFIVSSIWLGTNEDTDAKLKKTLKELLKVLYIFEIGISNFILV